MMLQDQELRAIAGGVIRGKLQERQRIFHRETYRVVGEAVESGRLQTGYFLEDLTEHFCREAKARGQDIWAELHRVVTTVGAPKDEDLSIALRGFVVEYFAQEIETLKAELSRHVKGHPGAAQLLSEFQTAADQAVTAIRWEIDLYLRSVSSEEAPRVQNVYHAPVGTVVAGGSVSIGTQYVMGDLADLRRSVEELLRHVRDLPDAIVPDRDTVMELLADARREVETERPKKLKVSTLLSGVAATVRTIPAVSPAYQTVKSAAAQVGIPLP